MSRLGHYLKPGVRATTPGSLFTLVIDPVVGPGDRLGITTEHTFGAAHVCHRSWRNGKWSRVTESAHDEPPALWKWMKGRADAHRRNYVFSPVLGEALAVGRFWDEHDTRFVKYLPVHSGSSTKKSAKVPAKVMQIRRVSIGPRVGILDYTKHGFRWLFLGANQYFLADEEHVAESMGWEWPDTAGRPYDGNRPIRTKRERAGLWMAAFVELADWWRANARAPWGLTASAMSVGMLRTHVPKRSLCTHAVPETHALERQAAFGGRASVWFYGDVGEPARHATANVPAPPASRYGSESGPMVNLDVKSMYPSLLRDHTFPVKRLYHWNRVRPAEVYEYAKDWGVIARVRIRTERAEYPERVGDRVYYRVGEFTTTLTGPELIQLRADGRIVNVYEMAVYQLGRPFRGAAAALIDMRLKAQCAGRPAWEMFAKLMSNGLAGKLAQKRGQWEPAPHEVPPTDWGEWIVSTNGGKGVRKFRALAGIVWEYLPDPTGAGPYTAAFAYLAAYGRLHMRRIRDRLPERSVVSQDTDGLWCRLKMVAGSPVVKWVGGGTAGELVVRKESECGRFYSAKHYFTDCGWVLSGFRAAEVAADGATVSDTFRLDNHGRRATEAPHCVTVCKRTSTLKLESHGMKIGPDGWAVETVRR